MNTLDADPAAAADDDDDECNYLNNAVAALTADIELQDLALNSDDRPTLAS